MSEIRLGKDLKNNKDMHIDTFDREKNNYNINIFGQVAAGADAVALKLVGDDDRCFIVDVEGELRHIADNYTNISLGFGYKNNINPFQLIPIYDAFTDSYAVDMDEKISNLVGLILLIDSLIGEPINNCTPIIPSLISRVIKGMYKRVDTKKEAPAMTDFYKELSISADNNSLFHEELVSLASKIKLFIKGEVFDLLDRQTSIELGNEDRVIISLDSLDETMKPIVTYVSLIFLHENIFKGKKKEKTRIIWNIANLLESESLHGLANKLIRIGRVNSIGITSICKCNVSRGDLLHVLSTNSGMNILLANDRESVYNLKKCFGLAEEEVNFLENAKLNECVVLNGRHSNCILLY